MNLTRPSADAPVQLPHTRLMEHAQVAMQTATLAPSLVAPAVTNSTSLVELSVSHAPTIVSNVLPLPSVLNVIQATLLTETESVNLLAHLLSVLQSLPPDKQFSVQQGVLPAQSL